jgi:cell division septal protein FtsQ
MARVALPESKIRARRKRLRFIIAGVAVAAVFLVTGLLAWGSHAPFLKIERINITGAATLASSTIQSFVQKQITGNYLYIFAKDNILLYPKHALMNDLLSKYPVLKVADVHADDFHTVKVAVVERQPKALWCKSEGDCYFMDEDGTVYGEAPTFSAPVYQSYFGKAGSKLPAQYLSVDQFHTLSALVDAIAQKESPEQVESVKVDGVGDVRMNFTSGFTIIFPLSAATGDTFERYSLALTSDPFKNHPRSDFLYLDLRFGDKLYYKLKTE